MDVVPFLRGTDLLRDVDRPILDGIARQLQPVELAAGEILFQEDEPGDAVYFIEEGTLRIAKRDLTLLTRGPGESIGEFALLEAAPRSASVVAETDSRLLRWSRQDFHRSLHDSPQLLPGINRLLVQKLLQDVELQVAGARLQQDLDRAREIQQAMLPADPPPDFPFEISATCRPAHDVGGDFYDFVLLSPRKVGLLIADVMGHGFYSGLHVAMTKSCFHTQIHVDPSPSAVMKALDRAVLLAAGTRMLMSCCYLLFDLEEGSLTYANAGHPSFLHLRAGRGKAEAVASNNLVLGFDLPIKPPFTSGTLPFGPGDLFVLYTDGITEAKDAEEEELGEKRLLAAVEEVQKGTAEEIESRVLRAAREHAAEGTLDDDLTVLVARVR